MALIACPECQREVSNQALTCPHCGYCLNVKTPEQRKETKKSAVTIFILIIVAILAVVIVDASTVTYNEAKENLMNTSRELQETRDRITELEIKKGITDILIDYYS